MSSSETAGRERYRVSVGQYSFYQKNGYLLVRGLLPDPDTRRLAGFMTDLYEGKIEIGGAGRTFESGIRSEDSIDKRIQQVTRAHMLHRIDPTCEWALLHPRLLDVLEGLTGPDVLALQSMLFFNPPGRGGQGWHQDSYYIPTYPDTLIGVWVALDEVDEENGCLWVVPGSNGEPVYPPDRVSPSPHSRDAFEDLNPIENASHLDDEVNTLSRVVKRHENQPVPVRMSPGDVLFFHSHLFHRSHPNRTEDRYRKSFVGHYCNARSWVPWNHGQPYEGDSANHMHILARGGTHLRYADPVFGTPVERREPSGGEAPRMMGMDDRMMPGTTSP